MKVQCLISNSMPWLIFFQYVEFAGGEDDEDETDSITEDRGLRLPNPNAEKANKNQGQSLETLLMMKNKRLLDDLTKFRVCTAPWLLEDVC